MKLDLDLDLQLPDDLLPIIKRELEEELPEVLKQWLRLRVGGVGILSNNQCGKCDCDGFIPRATNPNNCKRRGCGHNVGDHF